MSGWARLWLIVTCIAAGAITVYGLNAFEYPLPARQVARVSQQVIEEMGKPECKHLLRYTPLNRPGEVGETVGNACTGLMVYRLSGAYGVTGLAATPADYREHIDLLRREAERRNERFYFGVVYLPALVFVGLWVAYFVCRSAARWVKAGFVRDQAPLK